VGIKRRHGGQHYLELPYGPVNYTCELLGQSMSGTMNLLTGEMTIAGERFTVAQPQLVSLPRLVLSPSGQILSA